MDVYRSNLELGLKQRYHAAIKKEKVNDIAHKILYDEAFGPIKILDHEFSDIRQLKNHLKLIVNKTKNGDVLDEKNFLLVNEILKHHPGRHTMGNIVQIKVDVHPQYKTSRCYIMVKDDGTEQDFSFHKCLNNIFVIEKQKLQKEKHNWFSKKIKYFLRFLKV